MAPAARASASAAPEVSVVIVSARSTRLAFALDALAAQTLARDRFEVVVVRDPAAAESWAPRVEGVTLRVVEPAHGGNIAALRNEGWRAAGAQLVAFTDDDCRPSPGWLAALMASRGSSAGTDVIVQGRTEPDPDEVHLAHGLARTQLIPVASPWLQTCNIAYSRATLERLGGFDERFEQIGEDADLGCRAIASGAEVRFAAEALVWHAVNPRTLGRAVRDAARRDTLPLLVKRHPPLRGALHAGVFAKPSHAWLAVALAGSLAARGPLGRWAAWAPYVAAHVEGETLRRPRRVVHALMSACARVPVDAVEVATSLRGSIRERTLVL